MLSIFSRISHQQDFNYGSSSFTRFPDELIGRLSLIHSWIPKMSTRVETVLYTTSTLKCATLLRFFCIDTSKDSRSSLLFCARERSGPTRDRSPWGVQPNDIMLTAMPWAKLPTWVSWLTLTFAKAGCSTCVSQGDRGSFYWEFNYSTFIWQICKLNTHPV